jgi:alkylation response protein AidB-like acyl-CoA dehydrogenase
LSAVVNGEQTVAVAFATDPVARIDADLLLAQRGDDWHLLRTDSVDHVVETSVDGSRRLGTISWESTESTLVTSGGSAGFLAKDRGVVGLSAQLLGLATHLLEATVEYVKVREQFGKPIGAQQALKHKLADVLLAIEFAGPVVARAAHSLAVADPQASLHASMAKCFAADAAKLTARHALQCHGAIAYTTEFDLHMWMKRVWALAAQWGDANHHRRRVGELLSSS